MDREETERRPEDLGKVLELSEYVLSRLKSSPLMKKENVTIFFGTLQSTYYERLMVTPSLHLLLWFKLVKGQKIA